MMSTRGSSLPSIETRDLTAGKIFQVYRNGDPHFFGKRYVLNPRQVPNFDAFLNDLKRYVPTETAIRRVYTPSGGHRITDYSQLESEKVYVCAGKERFKRLK
ncbi:Hypothetical predicted protein [Mytilus galloprovincialis]|uniref:Doublecortin domain-containing protein n=1 Tax=Mytilus galloprovincialis TaxID=29158 RepID=A0A8B6D304_MYTGA|nr:Hypothetical predicted protein [Mytilus galloprovincialis]